MQDYWGRLSATYDDEIRQVIGQDLLEAISAAVVGALRGGDVVELGCGTGLFTREYAQQCHSVLATDISAPMVAQAQRAVKALPGVSVQVADAVATGLPGRSADAVVALNLLHVVADPAAVLAEARRLLRPGGLLIAGNYTTSGVPIRQVLVTGWRVTRRFGRPRARAMTQRTLEELLRASGFEVLEGRLLMGRRANAVFVAAARG